jgi:hypothetical protein
MLFSLLKKYAVPLGACVALVILIDLLTNTVTKEILFDSKIYIEMAQHGFGHERVSPFIYRFAGPFLAGALHRFLDLPFYQSFKVLAYLGAIGQLFGIFLFVRYLTNSEKSAYVGVLFVAFSLYNIKYPLFDVYRPDILAYPIILMCMWFVFKDEFVPLLLTTILGLQFREFVIVPLLAYLAVKLQYEGIKASIGKLAISSIGLLMAVGLPRWLISVEGHIEAVELSLEGISQSIALISMWARDINVIYVILAYSLPLLLLSFRSPIRTTLTELSREQIHYLAYYSGLVLLLLFIGGTDLYRFAAYFFIPLAVLTGLLATNQSWMVILPVLLIQIIFNRIWLSNSALISFYGGWYDVINNASLWRFAELIVLAVFGNLFLYLVSLQKKRRFLEGSNIS